VKALGIGAAFPTTTSTGVTLSREDQQDTVQAHPLQAESLMQQKYP
jgi:hypothetical protein